MYKPIIIDRDFYLSNISLCIDIATILGCVIIVDSNGIERARIEYPEIE